MEINKIYNEDNLETMAKMPNDFIDLIVTSPPYNIGINYDIYNYLYGR
jgi:DNA modification methylase